MPLLGLLALWAVVSIFSYFVWTRGADHRDFYPRWAGARFALFERRNLYSVDTTRDMQILLYGAPLPPDRDQQGFAYPAQLVLMLLPFWFIKDVEIATAAWQGFSVVLIVCALIKIRQISPSISSLIIIILMVWVYSLTMIFQAQVTAIPIFSLCMGFYLYLKKQDTVAGLCLSLGFIKVELVIIPVLIILLIALRNRRWRMLVTFTIAGLMQLFVTILIFGWWIPHWIKMVQLYSGYAASSIAFQTAQELGAVTLVLVFTILAVALLRMKWSQVTMFAMSLPLGMLIMPITLIWHLTLLIPSLLLAWRGRARIGVVAVWCLGWVFFIINASNPEFWRVQNLVIPLLTVVVVSWASHSDAPKQPNRATT
jgi:hypothetical protein